MKRLLEMIGHLKKLSGQVGAASEGIVNVNGQDTVFVNPKWMEELANNLDVVAGVLAEVIGERISEPHIVSEDVGWVCIKCIRVWAEEIEKCPICGITKEEAKGEDDEQEE